MSDNYALDLLGGLDQSKSKKQINADIKTLEKTINMLRLTATLAQGSSKKELNAYIKQLSAQLSTIKLKAQIDSKNLKNEVNKALNNVSFKDIDALNIDENKTKLKVQKVVADTRSYIERNPISLGVNIDSKRSKLDNDLTTYLNKYTKITESSVLLEEANKVRDLIDAITDKKSLTEATDAFRLFKSEVSATGYTSKSTADKIKSMLSHITKIGSAFGVASMLINNFTKSLKTLRENDTILTEISKTSEMTKNQLKELGDEAFKIASKYGQLSSNFLLATQEMARAGYDDNVKGMAELSTKAQGAGDMTAELSNQYIIATDKAFKMNGSIETLTATLDGANNITNNNALAMADLAEAMSIIGSQAASSGMEVNETTAAVATMIAATQRSGSEAANALKGIIMNLRQVTGDVGDGEDIIDADSLTKYEKACAELGVSLSTVKDGVVSLKEPMQIIKELAEAYTQLDEADAKRANLLSAVGGKYRANALNAILENYDMYEKMLKEYADGLGSMDAEAEKTAKSWEGRLAALQNSWDSFINTLTNKEAIMGGVSFLDRLIQGAETFVDTFGTIPTVLTAINSSMVAMKKDYGLTKIWDAESKKVDLEGNLFGIDISKIKNLKKHYEEAAVAISDWNCELLNGKTNLDIFENACVKNSAQLKEYLSTCSKDAPASLKDYRQYLESTGQATEDLRLKTILLNTALTFLGSLAIQIVITGIAKAFDKFNETVEESQGKVDDINSKISDLKSQIEELNSIEYKSDFDRQKITQLERELELQEQLLEIEQKRLYQNQIGTSFSDYFDGESLVSKKTKEENRYNKEGYEYLSNQYDKNETELRKADEKIAALNNSLSVAESEAERLDILESLNEATEKRNEILDKQIEVEEQLTLNSADYLNNYQLAQNAIDSGLLTGSDLKKAEEMAEYWNQMYFDSLGMITNIQKRNGTYDSSGIIKDILAKADFQEASKQLEELGKSGELSIATLSSRFPELIEYLKTAGISAEELYQYIMALSNPDAINYDNVRKQLMSSLGFGETIDSTSEAQLWNEISSLCEEEVVLEAYLKVRDQYGEHPEGWNAKDWIAHIQSELETELLEINAQLSISQTIDQLNTRIKPAFDSLQSAYQDIFTDDGFALNSIDILSTCDSIKSKLDEMSDPEGLNLDVDYSAFEDFVRVLNNTESTEKDVEIAFDALATSITNAGLSGIEDFETMKAALEDLGVVNETIVAFQALAENTDALKESGLDLENATYAQLEAFAREKLGAEDAAQGVAILVYQQMLVAENPLDTMASIQALANLGGKSAETAGILAELAQIMAQISNLQTWMANNPGGDASLVEATLGGLERKAEKLKSQIYTGVDFENVGGGKSAASKAGSKAADAYLEAFEKELEELETLRDQGK